MAGISTELRGLLRLTAPILVTQLGSMMLGVVDTAVVGRLGPVALGAVGLGNSVFFTVSVLGFGWMLALDPLISQAVGAGENDRASHLLWQGAWVALVGTAPLSLAVVALAENIERFGIAPATAVEVSPYLYARLFGLLPFLWLAANRAFLQAHAVLRPLVIGVVVANVLNLPLSYLLVFGDDALTGVGLPAMGVPKMGAAGAGWASAASTVVQLVIAYVAVRALLPAVARGFRLPDRGLVTKVLVLGTPIGLSLAAEIGSFAIVTMMVGNLGTLPLAAHNVALTTISVTFQSALAIGAASAVRVGHAIGRGDAEGTRRAGLVAIASGATIMIAGAIAFVTIPELLARVLTDDADVILATVPLFMVAAAFQISDGVQAVAAGTLRGAGDTVWPFAANLAGHYAIGLPLGATLAFGFGWGAVGLWWGLSAGLTAVAVGLTARFLVLARRPIARA